MNFSLMFLINWTDGASGKTFALGKGSKLMKFKSRDDKISHTLPMRQWLARVATVATLILWALAQSLRDGHRLLVTLEMVLS